MGKYLTSISYRTVYDPTMNRIVRIHRRSGRIKPKSKPRCTSNRRTSAIYRYFRSKGI